MNKKYDEFTKLKVTDMSKAISDMTYLYEQTEVPYSHYKKILDETIEETISVSVKQELLSVYFKNIKHLLDEDEELFSKALICIALKVKPNDLRIKQQLALQTVHDFYRLNQKIIPLINPILLDEFEKQLQENKQDTQSNKHTN